MKLKRKHRIWLTDDFWYSLFDGGYIKPEKILSDKEDIKKVNEAIEVLREFKKSCEPILEFI